MKLLSQVGREILGLFVDDGAFAVRILLVVAASAAARLIDMPPLYAGIGLVIGLSVVLWESVWRGLRRRDHSR